MECNCHAPDALNFHFMEFIVLHGLIFLPVELPVEHKILYTISGEPQRSSQNCINTMKPWPLRIFLIPPQYSLYHCRKHILTFEMSKLLHI